MISINESTFLLFFLNNELIIFDFWEQAQKSLRSTIGMKWPGMKKLGPAKYEAYLTKMNLYLCYFSKITNQFSSFLRKSTKRIDSKIGMKWHHGCSDFNQENEIAKNETIFILYLKIQNKIWIIEKQYKVEE